MDVAPLLDRTLKAAGIPIVGVRIGDEADRRTWAIVFDADVTPEQRLEAAAIVETFDPDAAPVKDAQTADEARAFAGARTTRALWLWWFRETTKQEPTPEDHASAVAAFERAYKDTGA